MCEGYSKRNRLHAEATSSRRERADWEGVVRGAGAAVRRSPRALLTDPDAATAHRRKGDCCSALVSNGPLGQSPERTEGSVRCPPSPMGCTPRRGHPRRRRSTGSPSPRTRARGASSSRGSCSWSRRCSTSSGVSPRFRIRTSSSEMRPTSSVASTRGAGSRSGSACSRRWPRCRSGGAAPSGAGSGSASPAWRSWPR